MRDAILKRVPYVPSYVPKALQTLDAEVVVRLRQSGYLRGGASAGTAPIAEAVGKAASLAIAPFAERGPEAFNSFNRMLIEIEVIGEVEPIEVKGDWTAYRAVDAYLEPGVHGVVFMSGSLRQRICPTDFYTTANTLTDALRAVDKHIKVQQLGLSISVRLGRFRTEHWYQTSAGDEPVSLTRGLTIIPETGVTAQRLGEAISRLAEYMLYRQQESGVFAYQYEPAKNLWTDEQNWVRQAGAVAAMATHAEWSGKAASAAAATKGIQPFLEGLVDIPVAQNAAFLATVDHRHKLGTTALMTMALARHPNREKYADVRRKLVNGMLFLQRPSGMFVTAFPPAEQLDAQDYFPGEALLAMAMHYQLEPGPEVLKAFDKAISFYRDYFREGPAPAFVPWQVQAYAIMAEQSKREDYVKFVFELTDWLAAKQLGRTNSKWPEMWGGVAAYQEGRAGVATAAYLEGFADALTLARRVGDRERARRYEKVVRGAARFVMQLQIRPEEAFFIRSPQDAVWGIRTTPSLPLLRIDHCQHALIGLIKARDALFPKLN